MGGRVEEFGYLFHFGSYLYCRINRTTDYMEDLLREAGEGKPGQSEEGNPIKERHAVV